MRKNLFLFLYLFLGATLQTNAQSWEWMKGAQNGESEGWHITADYQGNVYSSGHCWFNGEFGPYTFSTDELAYMPLVKYDSSGNIQWLLLANHATPIGLTTDNIGNEYMLCVYSDSVLNFGGSTITNPYANDTPYYVTDEYYADSNSYFITKINSAGEIVWIKNLGHINDGAAFFADFTDNCIVVDSCGSVYLTGAFINKASIGSEIHQSVDTGVIPQGDIFLTKLDSAGNIEWFKTFGGDKFDYPIGIAISNTNEIYLTGNYTSDSIHLGSITLSGYKPNIYDEYSSFLTKLDATGNVLWAKSLNVNDSVNDFSYGISTDHLGNVFLTGGYNYYGINPPALTSFDTVALPISHWNTYSFLLKYDGEGNINWGKAIIGQGLTTYGSAIDPCNNVWFTIGNYDDVDAAISDTIGGQVVSAPSINYRPLFISAFSNTGDYITTASLSSGGTFFTGLTSDYNGDLFVTSSASFDPFMVGSDSLYDTDGSDGAPNMFVAKFNPNLGCSQPYSVPLCAQLSINNISDTVLISIYPNPVQNELTVDASFKINSIRITNLLGQAVFTGQYNAQEAYINTRLLKDGMYFITVNNLSPKKFLKQ